MTAPAWIYEHSADGTARYVLGTVGDNPFVCVGVNPSTAKPGALDATMRRVSRFAQDLGHDSWLMLNLYPQIATDPRELHHGMDEQLAAANELAITRHLADRQLTLVAAWGSLIASRPYLRELARRLATLDALAGSTWRSLGAVTRDGHPRHPLYLRADTPLQEFAMNAYIGSDGAAHSREP